MARGNNLGGAQAVPVHDTTMTAEMAAFDQLPRWAQQVIRDAATNFSSEILLKALQQVPREKWEHPEVRAELIAAVRDKDIASARALYASYRAVGKKIR